MSAIEQILGLDEEGAMTLLSEWIRNRNFYVSPEVTATTLTECQVDALRFLSGGSNATCGSNSTSYASCVPEKCGVFENASLADLWGDTSCKLRCLIKIYLVLDPAALTIADALYLNNNSGRDTIQKVSI